MSEVQALLWRKEMQVCLRQSGGRSMRKIMHETRVVTLSDGVTRLARDLFDATEMTGEWEALHDLAPPPARIFWIEFNFAEWDRHDSEWDHSLGFPPRMALTNRDLNGRIFRIAKEQRGEIVYSFLADADEDGRPVASEKGFETSTEMLAAVGYSLTWQMYASEVIRLQRKMDALFAILARPGTKATVVQRPEPSLSARGSAPPSVIYQCVDIDVDAIEIAPRTETVETGRKVALHEVRGHIRTLASGKQIKVRPHQRGSAKQGVRLTDHNFWRNEEMQ